MITHIDHIAIAVNSIEEVREFYEKTLGLSFSHQEVIPSRGLKTAFITIGNTKLELLEPLHEKSEISSFLQKRGPGVHHVAFNTSNISHIKTGLIYEQPQVGAHNTLVNFIHPKSSGGVLMELVQCQPAD